MLSLLVILVLGTFLLDRVESGLLDAKVQAALAEAATGSRTAQDAFDSADRTDPTVYETVLRDLVDRLASAGGAGRRQRGRPAARPADGVGRRRRWVASSFELRRRPSRTGSARSVQTTSDQLWTYGAIARPGGGQVPVVTIGSPGRDPHRAGPYELYFVFPLDKEQETLDLVRRTLALAALGLVLLVGGIAWLVTRQVVTPVRMAARIAERLAAGRLEERMRVRGEDDLARLAASFNRMATSLQRQIRQLEDLSRVQRRFVSDVSHELRTPLTTVRMAADVLHEARDGLRPGGRAQRRDPADPARPVRGAARRPAGDQPLRRRRRPARGRAHRPPPHRRAGDRGRRAAGRAPRQPSRADRPGRPCVAEVDGRRIERVLRNLVVNAIEHGEGRPIDVRLAADDDAVAVAVRDRGVGLRPGEASPGLQPVLARRPGPGAHDRRHRPGPVDRLGGRPPARRLAAGVG